MKIILTKSQKANWNEKTKITCIYKVTNLLNGKVYIGQSVDFRKRASKYRNAEKEHAGKYNRPIIQAIRDDGADNFNIVIIEECDITQLNDRERYYIAKYNATNSEYGYNMSEGLYGCYSLEANIKKIQITHWLKRVRKYKT